MRHDRPIIPFHADRIEERADRMDQEMDKLIEARSVALESHARTLCTRVNAMRELQDALEYRHEGAPLVMLEPSSPASATPTETTAKADVGSVK